MYGGSYSYGSNSNAGSGGYTGPTSDNSRYQYGAGGECTTYACIDSRVKHGFPGYGPGTPSNPQATPGPQASLGLLALAAFFFV